MAGSLISIENLTKKYGRKVALENVSLSIDKGDVVGVLGPNGAGKTTLVSIISAMRKPTYGKILFLGKDISNNPVAVRKSVGIVFQGTSLDPRLTVKETLLLHASLFEMDEALADRAVQETMIEFGLHKIHGQMNESLSNGQRQLVEIAKSMLHKPSIFIFDEPTVGLDPEIRKLIWEKIGAISADKENTVIITSHYLEEIEQLCEKAIFLKGGKVLLAENLRRLKEGAGRRVIFSTSSGVRLQKLEKILGNKVSGEDGEFSFEHEDGVPISELVKKLAANGIEVKNISIEDSSLEELYLSIMGGAK